MQSLTQLVRIDEAINSLNGVFPGAGRFNYLFCGTHGFAASNWSQFVGFKHICTRAEFEARKAERQNKPSWSECPDWARYVAQDSNGDWQWFSHTPFISVANGWNALGRFGFSQSGKVIGDWRNTLEQRPNHIGESDEKGRFDFEALANQFNDADDINAVWALRDKLHHKNKPEPSPELSFHLSNAFNELQASARLLPENDPRRAQLVALAGGVSAVREVA